MNAWFQPRRSRAVLILSAALVVAGLVPLLYFVGLLGWQIAALVQTRAWVPLPASLLFTEHSFAFIPQFPWAWLMSPDSFLPAHTALVWVLSLLHAGLAFGLVGLGIIALGVMGVLRQYAAIRAQRQQTEERLRRVSEYRDDDRPAPTLDERLEPYLSVPKSRAAGYRA